MTIDLHKPVQDFPETVKWLTLAPPESISALVMKALRREDSEGTGYGEVRWRCAKGTER